MPTPLSTPSVALPLLLAGDCTFTLVSRRTGTRYTYNVTEAPANPRFPRSGPAWFVKTLVAPDQYAYLGMLSAPRAGAVPTFGLTRASTATITDPRVKGLGYLFDVLRGGDADPRWQQCEVWHSDTCARCGRPLTDPSSIAARLGPECYQHVHGTTRPTVAPTPVAAPVAVAPAAPVAPVAVEAAPAEPVPAVEAAPAPRKGRAKAAKAAPTPAPAVEVVEAPAAHPMRGPSGFLF
jgi:cell division septation protein DedD